YDRRRADVVMIYKGDIPAGADIGALLATDRRSGADVTLHLQRVADPGRFGCVPTDADGRVTAFLEKTPNPPTDQINAGCYVFRRSVIEEIPAGRPVSVERETFPQLLASGRHLQAHVDSSYWLDVGTPAAFVRGSADLVRGVAPSGMLTDGPADRLVHPTATVDSAATVDGGSTVGADVVVASGARITSSVLADGVRVA